jgi:hypothetical protein
LLPWDNLYFYYGLINLKNIYSNFDKIKIEPRGITIRALPVELENLDKIRSPVINSEGFDLTQFDKVILGASKQSDGFQEPHPLWEYPNSPLTSKSYEIFKFNFIDSINADMNVIEKMINIPLEFNGLLNGVAIWHIIDYSDNFVIDTGLTSNTISQGTKLNWHIDFKQTVHILDNKLKITDQNKKDIQLLCHVNFKPENGHFQLNIETK